MKWILKLIYFFNALLSILSLLAYISPFVNPDITWFFSFFALGFPILVIIHVAFLLFWLIAKPRYAVLSFLTLALGFYPLKRTIGINIDNSEPRGIEVLSYNIGHSKYLFDQKDGKQLIAFKKFIKEYNPEVVCLQERTKRHLDHYDKIFEGYELVPNEFIGTCIYSKLPVANSGNIYFDTNAHNATWADLVSEQDTFRVYSIHLSSNKVVKPGEDIKELWDRSLFILDKYNYHALKRTSQMEEIIKHSLSSPYPVLLKGDFNDVPQSYLYRQICKHFKDSFIEYGKGFAKTHKTILPILRIDYSFHSDELPVSGFEVIRADFSDHFPLLTSVNFKTS